jgi:tellurium resistance protein TerD
MGINLTKGGRINLSKEAPALKRVRVGLGWEANAYGTGGDFDLDASVFICKDVGGASKLISDDHFVFYGNLQEPEKALKHSGDNKTGNAPGDDESIVIDLAKLHSDAVELSFVVTIHEAHERKQNFGQVSKSHITLYDDETNTVIGNYDLEEEASTSTAVQFGSLYKKDGTWHFKAVGQGFDKGLADFVVYYGGTLA